MVKALITITSYNEIFYPENGRAGLFVSEALHPYNYFKSQGIDVDFVSETGTFGIDAVSITPNFLNNEDKEVFEDKTSAFNVQLAKIKKASSVNADDYQIFYASAGHATLFDYPTASGLQSIGSAIWANGGIVAAVCHGPAIFTNLKDPATGKLLIDGKKITGFTDAGETILNLDAVFEEKKLVSVEKLAASAGATYIAPPTPFAEFTVVDGRLVTGANPASATATAVEAVKAFKSL